MSLSDHSQAAHSFLRLIKSKAPPGLKRGLGILGRRLGTQVLSTPPLRKLANRSYNRLGRHFRNVFVRAFSEAAVKQDFLWTDTFLQHSIRVPVTVDYRYSWNVALSCRWSEPGVRRLSELLVAVAPADAVVFDVGANHGYVSYPFLASGLRCVLFEPQAVCVEFIRKTALLNGYTPTIEACVVSNVEGELDFIESACPWFSGLAPNVAQQGLAKEIRRVRSVTLDAYCDRTGLRPFFVKCDVEGHEWEVLDGARQVINNIRPVFSIEIFPSGRRPAIFDLFNGAGYTCFQIGHRRFRNLRNGEEFCSSDASDFIFCASDSPLIRCLEHAGPY